MRYYKITDKRKIIEVFLILADGPDIIFSNLSAQREHRSLHGFPNSFSMISFTIYCFIKIIKVPVNKLYIRFAQQWTIFI